MKVTVENVENNLHLKIAYTFYWFVIDSFTFYLKIR